MICKQFQTGTGGLKLQKKKKALVIFNAIFQQRIISLSQLFLVQNTCTLIELFYFYWLFIIRNSYISQHQIDGLGIKVQLMEFCLGLYKQINKTKTFPVAIIQCL